MSSLKPQRLILFLLTLYAGNLFSQNENANWLFGKALGISFASGVATPLPAPAHGSSNYITSTSCWSDKQTGKLLFYTNGRTVYDRTHKEMPNGVLSTPYYVNIVIVPDPGDSLQYYIFTSYSQIVLYAKVDLRLNGGLGDVIERGIWVVSGVDNRFAVVKQLYNGGYWLITHNNATNTFLTYRINKNGIQKTPVTSVTTEGVVWPGPQTFYSEIVTTTDGKQFAVMDNNASTSNNKFILLYDFDKKCGTVTLKRQILSKPFIYDIAYDAQGKFLYVLSSVGGGDRHALQYNISANNKLYDTLPDTPPLITSNEPMRHLKLAPDNKIYIAKEEMIGNGYSPSRFVDVIHQPSVEGIGCNYQEKVFNLSPNNQCFNDPCYLTDRFPNFIMDRTIQQPLHFEEPEPAIDHFCLGETTTFTLLKTDIYADSSQWDFGDTTFATSINTSHVYTHTGYFDVYFNWYLCGQKYSTHQKVSIGATHPFNLGPDTMLCNGHSIDLSPGAISEKYLWSTGDTTPVFTVKQAGTFSLKVRNGNCENEDQVSVGYYPALWTALGDEYFICDRDKELVKLDAGPGYVKYKWTPTQDTSQWIIVGDLGTYFVLVNDFRGCDGNDGTIVKRICPVELFYPNAFTPDGNGTNDQYIPIGNSVVSFEMTIYNRWGSAVFHTQDLNKGWNGKIEAIDAPVDVYSYVSTYSGYVNKVLTPFYKKGNFTLLR